MIKSVSSNLEITGLLKATAKFGSLTSPDDLLFVHAFGSRACTGSGKEFYLIVVNASVSPVTVLQFFQN